MFYPVFCLNTVITHNSTVITLQLLSKPPIYTQHLISAKLLLVTNTRSAPFLLQGGIQSAALCYIIDGVSPSSVYTFKALRAFCYKGEIQSDAYYLLSLSDLSSSVHTF